MKKEQIVIAAGAVLLIGFALAVSVYNDQKANKAQSAAQGGTDTPMERAYSVSQGPDQAKVTLVEFFDPGCETCAIMAGHVKEILAANPDRVRLVLRYIPNHVGSDVVVKMLEAARLQGRYWETLQLVFDTQPRWAAHHAPDPNVLWQYLPSLGLDLERLRTDMESQQIAHILRQDTADAQFLGVRKTPEFFVNGRPLPSFGVPQLQNLVSEELLKNY